ncbi:MAG TPA: TrmH family RNA methyltransferase [Solirubrobacterales bacterium]|nr:TrmH family RNA methyltransferase [Solirubrobacterales bacterium]
MNGGDQAALIRRYRTARRDPGLAVLEGFHALKHALRFGGDVVEAVAADPRELRELAGELAPDLGDSLVERTTPVGAGVLAELVPQAPRTGVVAIARRPEVDAGEVLADSRPSPLVLLEDPRTMGNMGACVRVAAAADAGGVLTTGPNDPWHPDALRGAAGLHFALPVVALAPFRLMGRERGQGGEGRSELDRLARVDRPLVAIDPGGEDLRSVELPPRAILAFGTERHGLSADLLERADVRLGIPMREGVSSLNLATAVAAVLFAQRL